MPEFCTCGAELPPDARFCHKCGKPQRDEYIVPEEELAPPPAPKAEPVPVAPPAAHLNLALALRTALLTTLIWFLLMLVADQGGLVWLLLSGFLGVFFYQRRGGRLSAGGGARMGSISGLMIFALFGLPSIYVVSRPDLMREALAKRGMSPEMSSQMLNAVQQVPLAVLIGVIVLAFTLVPLIGGWIGAKVLKTNG